MSIGTRTVEERKRLHKEKGDFTQGLSPIG